MTARFLVRLSGVSAMLGGVLIILARVAQVGLFGTSSLSQHSSSPSFVPAVGLPGFAGGVLLLLGVVGLYARQFSRHTTFGLVSFIVAFFGISLSNAANWLYAFGSPLLRGLDPELLDLDFLDPRWAVLGQAFVVAYLAGALGWFLLAVHTLLARTLPLWVPLAMLITMGLAAFLPLGTTGPPAILLNFLLAAGPIAFGYALWAELEHRQDGAA